MCELKSSCQCHIFSPVLYQMSDKTFSPSRCFYPVFFHIQMLWELVLLGEALVVMAPSPAESSETVLALVRWVEAFLARLEPTCCSRSRNVSYMQRSFGVLENWLVWRTDLLRWTRPPLSVSLQLCLSAALLQRLQAVLHHPWQRV